MTVWLIKYALIRSHSHFVAQRENIGVGGPRDEDTQRSGRQGDRRKENCQNQQVVVDMRKAEAGQLTRDEGVATDRIRISNAGKKWQESTKCRGLGKCTEE